MHTLNGSGVEVPISFVMYININNQEPNIKKCRVTRMICVYSFVYEVSIYYCDCAHTVGHGVPFPLVIMVIMGISSEIAL